jgi:hypothetical protein
MTCSPLALALHNSDRTADAESARIRVKVTPPQREEFAATHARVRQQPVRHGIGAAMVIHPTQEG